MNLIKHKTFFYLLPILVFCTTLTACKKVGKNDIDATIYVKEYKTGIPIANAKVIITKGRSGSGIGSTEVETIYTDGEGKVDYNTKKADADYMYYAEAYKEKYFDTHNQQVSVSRGEKNFTTTIYMYAESYVKLHVKNVNPFNQYDVISLNSFCYTYLFVGYNVDTTFSYCIDCDCKWFGNYEYALGSFITKNGIDTNIHFNIYPRPMDTIIVDLNY